MKATLIKYEVAGLNRSSCNDAVETFMWKGIQSLMHGSVVVSWIAERATLPFHGSRSTTCWAQLRRT